MPSQAEIKFVRSLHQKKFREEENLFIAEGPKVVEELLHSGYTVSRIFATGEYTEKNIREKKLKEKTSIVSDSELKKISALATSNQVLALAEIPKQKISYDVFNKSVSIVLDNISDPGNLGTIIRIAHWFGIKYIICSENSVEPHNPKVVQAAMGSLFFTDVIQTNLSAFFSDGKLSIPVYGTVLNGKSIYESKLQQPALIIFGNESVGISSELKQFISHPVSIPPAMQKHKPDSLNVASAAAIICSEFFR